MIAVNRGLGKNSPIKLKLNRQNYHALISRHGQKVRWMKASPCTCVMANNRPDPNCQICGGDGWKYDHPVSALETDYARVTGTNLITLPDEYRPVEIHNVWDTYGAEYEIVSLSGNAIQITGGRVPASYEMLEVSFTDSYEYSVSATGIYIGGGIVEVQDLYERTAYGTVPKFITEVTSGVTPVSIADLRVAIDVSGGEPMTGTEYSLSLKVVDPHTFILVNQGMRRVDQQWLTEVGGDAIAAFPNSVEVGPYDVITPLLADSISRVTISKRNGIYDSLPTFYAKWVKKITTSTTEYLPGTDFVLWGRNQIKWVNSPTAGTTMMVEYASTPSYRVLQEKPNIRSSENQLLPRRVALKLISGPTMRDGL